MSCPTTAQAANKRLPAGSPKKTPPLFSGGVFHDRVCKPGSVIDSHLSRRIVANALQPPPRKQPGKPCFLHGVAPDRVYSNGRFHADACALTARFHPYLVGANFISFASPQAAKLIHSVAPPLPSKQGLCRLFFAQLGDIACSLLTGIKGRGGIFLLHFSSDRSGRALPVILALWSPDFPQDAAVGPHPATVRPGRIVILPDSWRNVKQVAIFFYGGYNGGTIC